MSEASELEQQMKELTAMMDSFKEALAPLEKQKHHIADLEKAAYQEYQNKVGALRTQKIEIDQSIFDAQKKANELKQKQWQLEARLSEVKKREEEEAAAQALQEEFLTLKKRWDLLTAGAPWREWAKDHQIDGGHKIVLDRKVILADPMGLGKTLTAIITCDLAEAATRTASPNFPVFGEEKEVYDYTEGKYVTKIVNAIEKPCGRKILYFCPATMVKNVESEFRMWAKHRSVVFIAGMTKAERNFVTQDILPHQAEYVVICNYEAWRKDKSLLDSLINLQFDTVIVDESHNVKDTKTIGYKGIRRILDEMQPPYVIPMTGTPILNRPQELFSQLTLVNPEQFYHENDFLYRYCEQDRDTQQWKFKEGGLERIAKTIGHNFLRRTKDQAGIVLPDKTVTIHRLTVDPELYPNQAKVREQMTKNAMILLKEDKAIGAAAMIAVFTRLRQIETWPAGIVVKNPVTKEIELQVDVEESQKIDYLIHFDKEVKQFDGLIPEVIEDERVVLFSQFKAPLKEIKDRIERMGKRAVILDGDTPTDIKEQIRIDFDNRHTPDRAEAKWDAVLCNYRVGGVGMNLTAATQMFILDEEWNPGKRDQAYDRIHRIGQEKPVTIHVILNEKTIDDWQHSIMERKEDLVEGFNAATTKDEFIQFLEDNSGGLA